MRRFLLASTLVIASCAPRPEQPAPPTETPRMVVQERGGLSGLTPNELVARLGSPALQIREGASLKLQFRSSACVLDAYLYPSGGALRVTHVDTRLPSGADTDQAACIRAFENPI